MKKKLIITSSLVMITSAVGSLLAFGNKSNLFVSAQSEEPEEHQILLGAGDVSEEKESYATKYFTLHQDDATRSHYPFDSTPEECLIMADGDRGVGGDWICFGEANPQSGATVGLIVTFSLTNIESFTSVVLRGKFYRDFTFEYDSELQYGNEKFIGNEFQVYVSTTYKKIYLSEIEINYTCAI